MAQLAILEEAERLTLGKGTQHDGPEYGPGEFADLRARLDQLEGRGGGATPQGAAAGVTAPVTAQPAAKSRKRSTRTMTNQTTQATTATAPQPGSNVATFDTYLQKAKELGALAGQGKNTGVTFLLECLEGGYMGVLSSDTTKHAGDKGDHDELAAAYASAHGLANAFDAKAGNMRKLRSHLKSAIDFGGNPKWGHGQPLGTVNELMNNWRALRRKNEGGLQDAYNMIVKFIPAQRRRDTLIDGDELRGFCYKPGARPTTAERVLESIRRTASKLATGKVANCPDMDDSAEVKAIITACTKRLTAIAKAKNPLKAAKAAQGAQSTQAAAA